MSHQLLEVHLPEMFNCSLGLTQWLRKIFHFKSQRKNERKSSESAISNLHFLPYHQTNAEKSTSTESLDSGFIELSESFSSFSLKSILRQNDKTTGIDPKKQVSICTPLSSKNVSGRRKERGEVMVCNDKKELVLDFSAPVISNVSSQIKKIVSASKAKLVIQYPELRPSIDILFEMELEMRLANLTPKKIAELLSSLRVILFCPPQQDQDIILNKIIDLLVAVSNTLMLEDLYEECLKMWSVCKSGQYYQNTEFYWTHVQTLMIKVWCNIIVL